MFRILSALTIILVLAGAGSACDYSPQAFTYGYPAQVQQFYQPQQFVVPQLYYAPTVQLGYADPVNYGVQAFANPLAVSYGIQGYGLGVPRVRVFSPFSVRVGGFRSRIIVR